MAIACVYCHPDRTIAMAWEIRDATPTLVGLSFSSPIVFSGVVDVDPQPVADAVRALQLPIEELRIALPFGAFLAHRFPCQPGESVHERLAFEVHQLTAGGTDIVDSAVLPLGADRTGAIWHVAILVSQRTDAFLTRCEELLGTALTRVMPAFAADIAAAIHSGVVALDQRTMLVIRRGELQEITIVGGNGRPLSIAFSPVDDATPFAQRITTVIDECRASMDTTIESVVLGGDLFTKQDLADCTTAVPDATVARLNPLRRVGADASDEIISTSVRLAHMVGPCVGLVLATNHLHALTTLLLPCGSSAAR
jgi:hypothetical protein